MYATQSTIEKNICVSHVILHCNAYWFKRRLVLLCLCEFDPHVSNVLCDPLIVVQSLSVPFHFMLVGSQNCSLASRIGIESNILFR